MLRYGRPPKRDPNAPYVPLPEIPLFSLTYGVTGEEHQWRIALVKMPDDRVAIETRRWRRFPSSPELFPTKNRFMLHAVTLESLLPGLMEACRVARTLDPAPELAQPLQELMPLTGEEQLSWIQRPTVMPRQPRKPHPMKGLKRGPRKPKVLTP